MSTILFQQNMQFGAMTNNMVAMLFALNSTIPRLNAAIGTASSGFSGTAGTEYEGPTSAFGIAPSDAPGAQGQAYASAMATIMQNWNTFWEAASGAIDAIDNGQRNVMW